MRRLSDLSEQEVTAPTEADIEFAMKMIPHHQLAIEMANEVLTAGKDDFTRSVAGSIIVAQQGEIDMLRTWLRRAGVQKIP